MNLFKRKKPQKKPRNVLPHNTWFLTKKKMKVTPKKTAWVGEEMLRNIHSYRRQENWRKRMGKHTMMIKRTHLSSWGWISRVWYENIWVRTKKNPSSVLFLPSCQWGSVKRRRFFIWISETKARRVLLCADKWQRITCAGCVERGSSTEPVCEKAPLHKE